jgi:DNA-directed RNA polymerase specialized sigma subunit
MEIEKGKTFKYLRGIRDVPQSAQENMKKFTRIKKDILDCLGEKEMTIDEISRRLSMPKPDVVFYLMTLVKYGKVQTGRLDDMDEYYSYKLK